MLNTKLNTVSFYFILSLFKLSGPVFIKLIRLLWYCSEKWRTATMCPFSSLQTQMNLQLCFINNSESEEEEEQEVGKKELKNTQVKNRGSRKWLYWLSWTWFSYFGPSPCVSGHRCWWRKVPFRSSRALNLLPKHRIPNSGAWRTHWRIYGLEWGQTTEPWWESNAATHFCQSGSPPPSLPLGYHLWTDVWTQQN